MRYYLIIYPFMAIFSGIALLIFEKNQEKIIVVNHSINNSKHLATDVHFHLL
jgi:uncharacterized membrane protein